MVLTPDGSKFVKPLSLLLRFVKLLRYGNISVTVVMEIHRENKPVVLVIYDSKKDNMTHIKTLENS